MGGGGTVWDSMAYDPELELSCTLEWVTVHRGIKMSEAQVAGTTSSCPLSLR